MPLPGGAASLPALRATALADRPLECAGEEEGGESEQACESGGAPWPWSLPCWSDPELQGPNGDDGVVYVATTKSNGPLPSPMHHGLFPARNTVAVDGNDIDGDHDMAVPGFAGRRFRREALPLRVADF